MGPFSVKTYFEYMLEDDTWGDNIMLHLITSMWGVRVSILMTESCSEIRLRHDMEWSECDFGLLYNCNSRAGHYSAVKRFDETGVEAKQVKPGQDYSDREDTRVRFESDVPRGMVLMDESKLKDLIRDSEFANKVRDLVREYGRRSSGGGGNGGDEGHAGGGGGKKGNEDTEDEPEIDEDVQLVRKGDVHCIRCNKNFQTTSHLKKHVKLYHKNVYMFNCEICDKGFHSMKGLREHQKIHRGSKLKCSQCDMRRAEMM